SQRLPQPQQTSGHGDGLQFRFLAPAIFQPDRSQDGISKLHSGRAARWMWVGEVSHMPTALWHYGGVRNRLLKRIVRIPRCKPELTASGLYSIKSLARMYYLVNVPPDNPWYIPGHRLASKRPR